MEINSGFEGLIMATVTICPQKFCCWKA